ncbi:biosynthetic-type acetolactate synthase large subunit [Liquorilactobacillus sicerae]|uniref:biosynthetic-type acetolactate synthase large subunit n=1 Tax=Liquorilactobacillus sicerae TaxID=1416943 RepID=UPI002481206E|nr:biosynthetic-type acetolactate synthase large subunit [Liquorilactobacillus sicerae]
MLTKVERNQSHDLVEKIGSDILLDELLKQKVELIFGYPGGAALPIYDSLYRKARLNILFRHEQGAVHAAEGYAKVSGKPGVVIVTSGPGATNTVTGLADAKADSVPLIVFTSQVTTTALGTNAFQEVNIVEISKPITKKSYQVRDINDLAPTIIKAFELATSGRPGPVLVDLPKNILTARTKQATASFVSKMGNSYRIPVDLINELKQARRPLLLIGGGIPNEKTAAIRQLVQRCHLPVVSSMLGLGIISNDCPLFLGMAGMHGTYAANMALAKCDFLLNIGSRFDDRLATKPKEFAPHAKIAHVDIDPHELNKIIQTDFKILADARVVIDQLNELLDEPLDINSWLQQVKQWKKDFPYHYRIQKGVIKPQQIVEKIGKLTHGKAIVVTDVGQHQMWVAQYYPFSLPHQLITSGGLGTMGFGLPAAIGAKFAASQATVVLFVGDGGLQMTIEELDVIKQYNLNIKIILLNNHALGMVRQWQDLFYEKRRSKTIFIHQPDFVGIAKSYGLKSLRLNPDNWEKTLADAFSQPQTVFIEVPIPQQENVKPMIAPGTANHELMGFK